MSTTAIFCFGKYRGIPCHVVAKINPGYILWAEKNVRNHGIPQTIIEKVDLARYQIGKGTHTGYEGDDEEEWDGHDAQTDCAF